MLIRDHNIYCIYTTWEWEARFPLNFKFIPLNSWKNIWYFGKKYPNVDRIKILILILIPDPTMFFKMFPDQTWGFRLPCKSLVQVLSVVNS